MDNIAEHIIYVLKRQKCMYCVLLELIGLIQLKINRIWVDKIETLISIISAPCSG